MKYKILVVDDEPIALKAISRILKNDTLQIITCNDYFTGKDAFSKHPDICLAIIDVQLCDPDMTHRYNGVALMNELKELNPNLIVIIISGDPQAVAYAKLMGADEAFDKPIEPGEISVVVNHYAKHYTEDLEYDKEVVAKGP